MRPPDLRVGGVTIVRERGADALAELHLLTPKGSRRTAYLDLRGCIVLAEEALHAAAVLERARFTTSETPEAERDRWARAGQELAKAEGRNRP